MRPLVDCDDSFKLFLYVIALNVALSASHKFLGWLAPRTKNVWDDKLYVWIGRLQTLLEWAMAARRR